MSLGSININPSRAAVTLQQLAQVGLAHWTSCPVDDVNPGDAAFADLVALLADDADLNRVQSAALRRLSQKFLVTDLPVMTHPQQRWMAGKLPPAPLRDLVARLRDRVDKVSGKAPSEAAPVVSLLVDAVAEMAWTMPDFRRATAVSVRQHLRERVIMHPDDGHLPKLGIPTLWAAAAEGAQRGRIALKPEVLDRLIKRLNRKAESALAQEGWAGFWDGYVLSLAQRGATSIGGTELNLSLSEKSETSKQFQPNWRDGIPGYADPLLANAI